jgi:hypothetical protein
MDQIAKRFVGSYTLKEIDTNLVDLFTPHIFVWHNYASGRMEMTASPYVTAMMRKLERCRKLMPDYVDEITHLHLSSQAFILGATASGTYPDGSSLYIARCLIISVEKGLITSIESYGDRSQSEPLDRLIPYAEIMADEAVA